jgi:tetratricopeptide (TPR) repeat protein
VANDRSNRSRGSASRGGSASSARRPDRQGQGQAARGDRQGRGGQPHRAGEARSGQRAPAGKSAPPLPPDVTAADLDPQVRRELRSLPKGLADEVAARLVASTRLVEDDPEAAYPHAAEAARIASRVAATREALGIVAYATGRWAQARTELRAAGRLSGSDVFLPIIADCERGLGRPDRALEIAKSPAVAGLDRASAVEMRIVASGARRDMGQLDAAVLTLQTSDLQEGTQEWSARLRYAYADALLAAGRSDDAVEWFTRAAAVDGDGATEAQDRLDELSGTTFVEDGDFGDGLDSDDGSGVSGSVAEGGQTQH